MITCYDSIYPANLPPGADAYLGYADGNWPTAHELARRFPGKPLIILAVSPATDAMGCDCESGDLRVSDVPGWVRRQLARGVERPVVYCAASNSQAVIDALAAARIARGQFRLLSAHWGGEHICAPGVCGYPQADGTQWTNQAKGEGGARIDQSALAADFFGGNVSATGPESWDQADFDRLRNHGLGWGLLTRAVTGDTSGIANETLAAEIRAAHAALGSLTQGIAAAVVTALKPQQPGGM